MTPGPLKDADTSEMLLPPSGIGSEPLCAYEADIPVVKATSTVSTLDAKQSLGVTIVQDTTNVVWFKVYNDSLLTISFVNPYNTPATSFTVTFDESSCDSSKGLGHHEITFDRKIDPNELVFIQLDAPIAGNDEKTCMKFLDIGIEPVDQIDRVTAQILTQARVGDWQNSVLLAEAIQKSGASLPSNLLPELSAVIQAGVRPLPSSDGLKNYEGYRSLLALNPENNDFKTRTERYRDPAFEAKVATMLVEDILGNLPFVESSKLYEGVSADNTRIQRDDFWGKVKGKVVSVSGRVYDVKPSGMIFPATIEIETNGDNRATCYIKEELESAAMLISKGSNISCTGVLSSYTLILGYVGVNIERGEFTN